MNRILIVEDNPECQVWLREIAREAFPESKITEANTRCRALSLCTVQEFDLALIDLGLPDGSGHCVVREMRAKSPSTICVIATVMGDDTNIVTALSAGAQGYLLKDQSRQILVRQLTQMCDGLPALSPTVARRIMDHFRLTGPCEGEDAKLTPRELEVLGLIARGLRITDAACALGLAEGTVATHIKAIYRKLGISSRAEAALHATRMGLLSTGNKA